MSLSCTFLLCALAATAVSANVVDDPTSNDVSLEFCVARTNGCSIPLNLPFPYKEFFKPACTRHDVCYTCGAKHGWTRAQCDLAFKENMKTLCKLRHEYDNGLRYGLSWWDSIKKAFKGVIQVAKTMKQWLKIDVGTLDHCLNGAEVYYTSVDNFASSNWVKDHNKYPMCSHGCSPVLGHPNNLIPKNK